MYLFQLSPTQKRNLSKILPFGFICFIFGIIWAIVEQSLLGNLDHYPVTGLPYDFISSLITNSFGSFFLGSLFGAFEVLYLNKRFIKSPFGLKILVKTIIYIFALCLFLISLHIIFTSINSKVFIFDPMVFESLIIFASTLSFWGVIVYMGSIIGVAIFFLEVSDNLGQGVLKNFLIGKYHKPRIL